MSDDMPDIVVVSADHESSGDAHTHFEDINYLKIKSHVWAREKHYVIKSNPNTVNKGYTFLFDNAGTPTVGSVQEFENDGEMANLDNGMQVRVDTLTGEYMNNATMGDPGPPPFLEECPSPI